MSENGNLYLQRAQGRFRQIMRDRTISPNELREIQANPLLGAMMAEHFAPPQFGTPQFGTPQLGAGFGRPDGTASLPACSDVPVGYNSDAPVSPSGSRNPLGVTYISPEPSQYMIDFTNAMTGQTDQAYGMYREALAASRRGRADNSAQAPVQQTVQPSIPNAQLEELNRRLAQQEQMIQALTQQNQLLMQRLNQLPAQQPNPPATQTIPPITGGNPTPPSDRPAGVQTNPPVASAQPAPAQNPPAAPAPPSPAQNQPAAPTQPARYQLPAVSSGLNHAQLGQNLRSAWTDCSFDSSSAAALRNFMASYTNPADRAAIADAIDLRNLITTESRGAYDSSTQTDNVQHLLLNVAYQGNPTRQSDMAWNLMTRDDGWTKWRELHETRRAIHQSLNEMNPAQRREFIRRYGVSADENQNRGMSDADLFTRGVANLRRDLATMQQSNSRHRTPEATGQFQDMYRWIDDAAR